MKEELNLIESQILRIFRNNHKNSDQSLKFKDVLDQSLKSLSENFEPIVSSLADKGFVTRKGDELILTDKGDQYLYHKKLYSDY